MNDEQLKQALKLIKQRCCNYDNGSCLIFDWSFCNICPQWISYSLNCKWFRNAVLPNEKLLCVKILNNHKAQPKSHLFFIRIVVGENNYISVAATNNPGFIKSIRWYNTPPAYAESADHPAKHIAWNNCPE